MQAVILAGGQGSRLYPLTATVPKPLLPILGRPLLGYLIEHLASQGVDHVVVTTGYLGAAIQEYVRTATLPLDVTVVQEMTVRGTAGAVADLAPALRSPFLVVSGDAVLSLDLPALVQSHRAVGGPVTLCVAPPAERFRFGMVDLRAGRVERFIEKPGVDELLPAAAVNSGAYLVEREALEGLPGNGPVDFAHDVFPRLMDRGYALGAARVLRSWLDVGTPEAYRQVHFDAITGRWPWGRPSLHAPSRLGTGSVVVGPVGFGPGVTVGEGSRILGPVYLGAGVVIGDAAEVARSILLEGARVGKGAIIRDAIVGTYAEVPPGMAVGNGIFATARACSEPTARASRSAPAASGAGLAAARHAGPVHA